MRQQSFDIDSTWGLWALMTSAVAVASVDGLELVGVAIWFACVTLQWVIGVTALVQRRRRNHTR